MAFKTSKSLLSLGFWLCLALFEGLEDFRKKARFLFLEVPECDFLEFAVQKEGRVFFVSCIPLIWIWAGLIQSLFVEFKWRNGAYGLGSFDFWRLFWAILSAFQYFNAFGDGDIRVFWLLLGPEWMETGHFSLETATFQKLRKKGKEIRYFWIKLELTALRFKINQSPLKNQ